MAKPRNPSSSGTRLWEDWSSLGRTFDRRSSVTNMAVTEVSCHHSAKSSSQESCALPGGVEVAAEKRKILAKCTADNFVRNEKIECHETCARLAPGARWGKFLARGFF